MKRLVLFAAAALLVTPALSQQGQGNPRNLVPDFQEGDNSRAGGPANELNSSTGPGVPRTSPRSPVPPYLQGDNNQAGGPANELIPNADVTGTVQTSPRSPVPSYLQGDNNQAGGPANELPRR